MGMYIDNMEDIMDEEQDFNNIPVEYCSKCLSLRVMNYTGKYKCYCDECGSVDIRKAHIEDWAKMFEQKYGKCYLPKNN